MRRTILLGSVVVMIVNVSSWAATRHVPAEYLTIQSAINDCRSGDTVIVAAGIYNERIDYSGKNIVVTSTDPGDPEIVADTIIDGNGEGSVVTFENSETAEAVLTGFTISGGYGTAETTIPGAEHVFWGAGIYCRNSSPTIKGNVIVNNFGPLRAENDVPVAYGYGGGIACAESSPIITGNIIRNNSAYAGGGIMTYMGDAEISNNFIHDNSAAVGGGVLLLESGRLLNNTIASNDASRAIPGAGSGLAGNVHVESGAEFSRFQIVNNIICGAKSGGGLFTIGTAEIMIAFNDVWDNTGGNYGSMDVLTRESTFDGGIDRTGTDGNISQDPLFAHTEAGDYHLLPDSPCISAGDPTFIAPAGQTDIDGEDRVYAVRIDMGADEFVGPVRLVAHAGADQSVGRRQPVTLDGSASFFRDLHAVNTYAWTQVGGPTVALSDAHAAQPVFVAEFAGDYRFELVISDGARSSEPDEVSITVVNERPIAHAGDDQTFPALVGEVLLDGSGSYDPTGDALTYQWTQLSGPAVELSDPNAAETSFNPIETGVYVFSLVVSDDLADSETDTVGIVLGNTAPVAHAGSSRYAGPDPVVLDGTGSYDPDSYGVLSYQWTQVSGTPVSITDADTARPTVGGFVQASSIRECEFQLVVSDGDMNSPPDTVEVVIVPDFSGTVLQLENPPFDPNKPTFIFFSGGNGGGGLGAGPPWEQRANMISFSTRHNGRMWSEHGNAIIVYLSSVAPDYKQQIQTSGFSKGGRLPIGVGAYLNTTYADSRYNVNHATVFDAPNPYIPEIPDFLNSSVGGEQSWVDNYRAGPSSAWPGQVINGALTVYFPLGDHGTPITWYLYSIDPDNVGWMGDVYNHGITAGPYYSVIGPGKNLELAPHSSSVRYFFEWDAPAFGPGSLAFNNEPLYPGRLPELPTLVGPADGHTVDANGVLLSCQPCQNVVGYQVLMGPNPHDLKYIISDTPTPPENVITAFPHETIYWTIRVRDPYGSTIFPDTRRLDVGDPVAPSVENVTKGRRYFLIQDAIDEATDGDEIVVDAQAYNYIADVNFTGKSVTLRSSSPSGEAAVIRGTGTGPAVMFSGGEDANCVLSGFTITGGDTGVTCYSASPTIADCTIAGNADAGADLFKTSKTNFVGCRISSNGAAGVRLNVSIGGRRRIYSQAILTNCIIEGNQGSGIHGEKPTVGNSTIVGNALLGIDGGMPMVTNSIVYGNNAGADQITGLDGTVLYSNIQGGFIGEGNIDAEPRFVDAEHGDFHLLSASPCINAGDPNSVARPNDVDIDGETRVMSERVDMGADEFNPFLVEQ